MSVKWNYNGPRYVSRDGNVFDNPYDAKAADTRYEQQQKIYKELKRQNDIMESKPSNTNEPGEELITVLLCAIVYTKVGCFIAFVLSMIVFWYTLTNYDMNLVCWISLGIGVITFLRYLVLLDKSKNVSQPNTKVTEQPKNETTEDRIHIRFGNENDLPKTLQHNETNTNTVSEDVSEDDEGPIKIL